MTRSNWKVVGIAALALVIGAARGLAQTPASEMAGAARALLAALDEPQKAKLRFEMKDAERENWHIIPRERKGLTWKELNPAQRHLATALLATGLSQRGFVKATTIMSLEQILLELEQGKGPKRDPENYFWSIFGQPSDEGTWGWRVEGHHVSLNFTVVEGRHISSTPSMFGTNPAEVREGARKGLRVMGAEEDLGRELFRALDEGQRKAALIMAEAPPETLTIAVRQGVPLTPGGIEASKLSPAQAKLLRRVIEEFVRRARPEVADADLAEMEKAGFGRITFGWAGTDAPGKGHYYRVQGPTFLIEYDNTQNNANHIHAVWREFKGDFGFDVLAEHYRSTPH